MRSGPTGWPLAEVPCPSLDELDEEVRDLLVDTAVAYLWNWTGKRFGVETVSARPCRADWQTPTWGDARAGFGSAPWLPVLVDGVFRNVACGSCGDLCGCDGSRAVVLPGPVVEIESVEVGGVTLDPSAYRVDNRRLLVRQDGGSWPTSQSLHRPVGEDDTWQVTYRVGVEVPSGGRLAAAVLACEFAKAVRGRDCSLPQRVQSVTREGVTVAAILDTFEGLDGGRTGIWTVDSWVASVTKPAARASVWSPDVAARRWS